MDYAPNILPRVGTKPKTIGNTQYVLHVDFYIDVFPLSLSSFVCIIQIWEWFLKFNEFGYQ